MLKQQESDPARRAQRDACLAGRERPGQGRAKPADRLVLRARQQHDPGGRRPSRGGPAFAAAATTGGVSPAVASSAASRRGERVGPQPFSQLVQRRPHRRLKIGGALPRAADPPADGRQPGIGGQCGHQPRVGYTHHAAGSLKWQPSGWACRVTACASTASHEGAVRQATQRSSATTRSRQEPRGRPAAAPLQPRGRRRRRLPASRHNAPGNLPDRVEPGGELPRPGGRRAASSQFGRADVEHLDTGRDPMRARVTQQPAVAAPQR